MMGTNSKIAKCGVCGDTSMGHKNSNSCIPAKKWEIALAWVLRIVLLLTVGILFFQGKVLFGLVCIVSIILVAIPAYLARTGKANLPVELELILLWFLISDNTLGRLALFYEADWFDKYLHFGNSAFIGFFSFLIVYVLLFINKMRAKPALVGLLILLTTLGIGALWEIIEYIADFAFQKGAQGSPIMSPLDDTMWDLILDGMGGLLGAIFGPLYVRYSHRSRCRFSAFAYYFQLRKGESG